MGAELRIGQPVTWQGEVYVIKALKPDLRDIVLEGKGGVERTLDQNEFYNQIAAGEIRLQGRQVEVTRPVWTETEKAEADFRLALLEFTAKLDRQAFDAPTRAARLAEFCRLHHRQPRSERVIKKYRQCHAELGYAGLVPNFQRRGGSGWSKKAAAKQSARDLICKTFARDDKLNVSALSLMLNEQLRQHPPAEASEPLSRKTVARMVHGLPKEVLRGGRVDPRTFALANRQAVQTYQVKHPLERVEIDATTIDVYCRDELGELYSRLTLYAAVCAKTSYPISLYVTGGPPSEYTLLKALKFFFAPKDQAFKTRFGIETDWVPPCAIGTLVLDNAAENHSDLVQNIVRRLGITIEYARPGRGDDKPHVESLFRALNVGVFDRLPGAKRSQDKRNKNRHARAAREACYSVETIYQQVVKFVADVYLHQPREKLGFQHGRSTSIKQAMDAALSAFLPIPPPALEDIERLILDCHRATRRVQHYGVDFGGFQYHSHALASLARTFELRELEILYNPEDCTAIYAVHPGSRELLKLPNKLAGVPSVSFDTAAKLRKRYRGTAAAMTGHDYQRIYAEMLAQYTRDSQRKPKVQENNQALRARERRARGADIERQITQRLPKTPPPAPWLPPETEEDEHILPAPRQDLAP